MAPTRRLSDIDIVKSESVNAENMKADTIDNILMDADYWKDYLPPMMSRCTGCGNAFPWGKMEFRMVILPRPGDPLSVVEKSEAYCAKCFLTVKD